MQSLKLKKKLPAIPEYEEAENIRLKRKKNPQMPVLSEDADMHEPDLKLKMKMPKFYEDEPDSLVTISFKVNVQERETLQKMARKMDLNISQTIRKMLFNSASEKVYAGLSTNDKIHKLAIAAKTVRSEFKRIIPQYSECIESYNSLSKTLQGSGDENTIRLLSGLQRTVSGLQSMTLDLQKSLNEFFAIASIKEAHFVSKENITPAKEREYEEIVPSVPVIDSSFIIKHCYMQKINIIGIIEEDARETKNGRAGFPVIVKTMKGTIEKKTKYYIFTNKDDSFPMLKKNVQVCVVGDLDISYRTNKETGELVIYNGKPIIDLTVSADSVVLCGNVL